MRLKPDMELVGPVSHTRGPQDLERTPSTESMTRPTLPSREQEELRPRTAGVTEVPLESLRRGFSARTGPEDVRHAQILVEAFAYLPPVVVHRKSMAVIDGNHRVLAARMLKRPTIPAVFFDGDEDEAYVEAVRHNVAHGRPLNLQERERAASHLIATHPDWSDRRISEVCGLAPQTVARRRRSATVPNGQLSRVGRDGKSRPTDPAAVRLYVAELLAARPTASLREIAVTAGSSEATVRDVRERLRQGESPLPRTQSEHHRCSRPSDPPAALGGQACWSEDTALRSTPSGKDFGEWFDGRAVDDRDWERHVETLPLSRLPLLAEEARRRADCWARLAEALGKRVRNSPRR